jgi:ABC-type transport system substrate-binding protein
LLVEAGYDKGLKLKLLATAAPPGPDQAQAIKRYLDDVGIMVDVDLADMGRFSSSVWVNGWEDMALFFTGLDLNYLTTVAAWFGHEPKTNLASFKRPPELIALSKESITYLDEVKQKAITKQMVRLIADEALMIPLFNNTAAYIIQPWVHTDYLQTGFIRWKLYDAWMEKH